MLGLVDLAQRNAPDQIAMAIFNRPGAPRGERFKAIIPVLRRDTKLAWDVPEWFERVVVGGPLFGQVIVLTLPGADIGSGATQVHRVSRRAGCHRMDRCV